MNSSNVPGYHSIPKQHSSRKGFTLVELLIALFVFSLCAGFAYRSIDVLAKSKELATEDIQDLSDLQRLLTFLENDLRWSAEITYKPVNEQENGDGELTAFTLDGAGNDKCREISPCKIRYSSKEGLVFRSSDGASDDPLTNDNNNKMLVGTKIDSFSVEGLETAEDADAGVLVNISHRQFGEISHIFFRGGAETTVMASAENIDLNTLEVAPLMPSTIGGVTELEDDEEPTPVVLDEADTVADGW